MKLYYLSGSSHKCNTHTHTHPAESPLSSNKVFEPLRPQHTCRYLDVFVCVSHFESTLFHFSTFILAFMCMPGVKSHPLSLSLFLSPSLSFSPLHLQSQGSPYSMSGQRNVRALWANCKGEGRQNQVCVSQPVWYIQRKEPWNTKACWWVSQLSHTHTHDPQKLLCFIFLCHNSTSRFPPFLLSTSPFFKLHLMVLFSCYPAAVSFIRCSLKIAGLLLGVLDWALLSSSSSSNPIAWTLMH